jgi:hypothetical protein
MDACVTWNQNATEICVGVSYSPSNYGPKGLGGGTQCWYHWSMPDGRSNTYFGLDSARLQNLSGATVHITKLYRAEYRRPLPASVHHNKMRRVRPVSGRIPPQPARTRATRARPAVSLARLSVVYSVGSSLSLSACQHFCFVNTDHRKGML